MVAVALRTAQAARISLPAASARTLARTSAAQINTARSVPSLCQQREYEATTRARAARISLLTLELYASRGFQTSAHRAAQEPWASKGEIGYDEVKKLASEPTGEVTIIDVREPNELASGMIPSAVSVPLSQFEKAFHAQKGADFQKDFAFPRPEFDAPIVFYCRSGKRSAQAQDIAQRNGWRNTRNYRGSYLDWVQQEERK